jgi:hypothetical protein
MFLSAPQRLTPATWRRLGVSTVRRVGTQVLSQAGKNTHVLDEGDPEAWGFCAGQRLLPSVRSHYYSAYAPHCIPAMPIGLPSSHVVHILPFGPQSTQPSSSPVTPSLPLICLPVTSHSPNNLFHISPSSLLLYPMVVSLNWSLATSGAIFAPERAEHDTPSLSEMTSAKMWMSAPLTSTPWSRSQRGVQ